MQLLSWHGQSTLQQENLDELPQGLIQAKKDELVHYMEMAYTAIKPFYEGAEAQSDAAKALLRRMEFGKDGYIFGYNDNGIRIVEGGCNARAAMRKSQKYGERAVDVVNNAGETPLNITHAVSQINSMNNQIVTAAEEQSHIGQEVSNSLDGICNRVDDSDALAKPTANCAASSMSYQPHSAP